MTAHLIGLIGAGIGSSLSPALHEREAQHHGLRYLYKILDISELGVDAAAAGDLVRTARRVGYTGFNITHPCKQTVIEHLDELSPDAARLGAVNTVTFDGDRAIGHNTDWTGFAESFARGLPDAATRRVVQVGAGAPAPPSRTRCSPWAPTRSPSSTPAPPPPTRSPPSSPGTSVRDAPARRPSPTWRPRSGTRTAW
ncbi:hypothetical protein [Actinomadura keratinilytica]|uniref:hypothetical protein n=1 Tax=Actinomadura keratinilytica TaxID=547461 RepID=UPI0036120E18